MRAVVITEPGDVDVLAVANLPDARDPGPGEVRLAVRAAAVNPTDIGLREHGGPPELPPPWIPGMDAAGTVESVGDGVERLHVGDQVMAAVTPRRPEGGAQAELIVVPAQSVVTVPDGAPPQQASTLPMNGLTAYLGLELLDLQPGQTIAVSGGAGLLASYAIPLAKERGLFVLADAEPDSEDESLVLTFGPDIVVPRGDDFCDAVRDAVPGGVDAVFDTALLGREAFPAIREGGAIAVLRGWDAAQAEERGITVWQVWVRTVLTQTDWLEELRGLALGGRLQLRVAAEYPPEEIGEAHRLMAAGGLRGRAVIVF